MALTPEDKADVARHLGKKTANKVSKVTRDRIATGIGYKYGGGSYKYPIFSKKHLDIIKSAGGKTTRDGEYDYHKQVSAKHKALSSRMKSRQDALAIAKDIVKRHPEVAKRGGAVPRHIK